MGVGRPPLMLWRWVLGFSSPSLGISPSMRRDLHQSCYALPPPPLLCPVCDSVQYHVPPILLATEIHHGRAHSLTASPSAPLS